MDELSVMPDERRRQSRITVNVPVTCQSGQLTFEGCVQNLSLGGACLRLLDGQGQRLPETVSMMLGGSGREVVLRVEAVWEDGAGDDTYRFIGLRFGPLGKRVQLLVANYLIQSTFLRVSRPAERAARCSGQA